MSQKAATEKWLVRVGLCALTLLPVAHLTSLGVMEMAGFVLLVVCAGLFVSEAINDGLIALNRVRSASALPILGYTAVTLISITLMLEHAVDQLSALRELKWVLYFFAFAYFFERFFNTAWGRYLPVFAAVITVMGAFSIGQFLFGIEYPRPESVLERWGDYFRVTGLFNVPQSFAGNLGMAVFFLLGMTLGQHREAVSVSIGLPWQYLVTLALGASGLVLSLTRAAWVASAVVGVLALGRVKKTWGLLLLLCLIGLAALGNGSQTVFGDRFSGEIDLNQQSIAHREALWEANWEIVKVHPWLGIGPWQNVKQLPAYYRQNQSITSSYIGHAHNNVLQVMASQGAFAAVFYLWFCAYFLWAAHSVSKRENADCLVRGLALGSLYSQLYFHLLGLVDSPFFDQEVKNMIVFIWALTFALYQRQARQLADHVQTTR